MKKVDFDLVRTGMFESWQSRMWVRFWVLKFSLKSWEYVGFVKMLFGTE